MQTVQDLLGEWKGMLDMSLVSLTAMNCTSNFVCTCLIWTCDGFGARGRASMEDLGELRGKIKVSTCSIFLSFNFSTYRRST